jgi:Protein of unknown function (DUF616)
MPPHHERRLRARAVIYTAIFGGYDTLKEPVPQEKPCDFICFTDMKLPRRVGAWRVIRVPRDARLHPRLQAKRFKLAGHEIFPRGRLAWRYAPLARRSRFDLSVWVDGSVQITSPRFLGDMRERLGAGDWAMFVHPDRDCIYDEAQVSIGMRKYRDLPICPQVESYRTTVPPHGGLHACTIIVRREPAPARLVAVHAAWWTENVTWTYQDQLSLPYVLRHLDGPAPVPITESLWNNPWFVMLPHTDDA